MSDQDFCEKCGENVFHRENSTECFMLQEWSKDKNEITRLREENTRMQAVVDAAREYVKYTRGMVATADIALLDALKALDERGEG